jgi:uncharacterized protein (TIGR00299 family) protein
MGVSGDMLLGALDHLEALQGWPQLAASLPFEVSGSAAGTDVNGIKAVSWQLAAADPAQPERRLADVLTIVAAADVPEPVRERAAAVFQRIAAAEAAVHGVPVESVHFHEVGAVDAILDVLGVCLGLHALRLDRIVVSPIALGGGTVRVAHGDLAVPGPAVLALLTGSRLLAHGGPVDAELATPTGVALLAEWATDVGSLPAARVTGVGVGAGSRRFPDRANVLRLVVAEAADAAAGAALLLETNVDDLEPRLWPGVIAALLAAGASDAWLTPILMKKGRPAHTLSVLVPVDQADAVRAAVFAHTSAIGLREQTVGKHALERRVETVTVRGHQVRVKLALHEGVVVNAQPEWDDVALVAEKEAAPAKQVLAEAVAAAQELVR